MKTLAKKRWVDALRSGEYEQTQGRLCDEDGRMCCLGVLIDVTQDGNWVEDMDTSSYDSNYTCVEGWLFRDHDSNLPGRVRENLGITDRQEQDLIIMNDEKDADFSEIADWVEANL